MKKLIIIKVETKDGELKTFYSFDYNKFDSVTITFSNFNNLTLEVTVNGELETIQIKLPKEEGKRKIFINKIVSFFEFLYESEGEIKVTFNYKELYIKGEVVSF